MRRSARGGPGRGESSLSLRRISRGEGIAALSALVLLAVTFVDWYGAEVAGQARRIELGGGAGAGGSAWHSLDLLPWFLVLVVAVAVGAAALAARGPRSEPPVPASAVVAVLGGLATVWIGLRILFPPGFGELGGVSVNATLDLGVWLGLLAAAGVAYGGYRAIGEHDTSFARIADDLSRDRGKEGKDAGRRPKRARSGA